MRDKLTKQADQDGVAEFVRFIRYVPEAYHLLSGFDAFVMPSISEAFGRVLLEAMAVKLPIIASSVGGIPEVLGDDANLVPPGQPGPLARQMRRYYTFSEEERRNRGEDSRPVALALLCSTCARTYSRRHWNGLGVDAHGSRRPVVEFCIGHCSPHWKRPSSLRSVHEVLQGS